MRFQRFSSDEPHWLHVVQTVNAMTPEAPVFARPIQSGPWDGGHVEVYPRARVVHHDDGTVEVAGDDADTEALIVRAAQAAGFATDTDPRVSPAEGVTPERVVLRLIDCR
jgi:hypothetical protein